MFQLISRWLYLPAMTGLLVLGMLLGPGGLGVLEVDAVIILIFVTSLAGPLLTRLAGKRLAREKEPEAEQPGLFP